jgi:hypothetical protein
LKRGEPGVSIGTLATAAFVLPLHHRPADLASPPLDGIGLALDEERVPKRIHRKSLR